jgi:hypothetical protein
MSVGIDLLRVEVGHDLDRALAKNVALKDVAERRLGIDGEDQHLVPLLRQPVRRGRGEGGLAESTLAAEHDVAAVLVGFECFSQ